MLICVGIPSIDGKIHASTVDALLAEQVLGYGKGVHFLIIWELHCSLIGVARNRIASKFLETKADCLIMVDSDISWSGGDLARLAQSPHDVIGGTYRVKRDVETFHIRGVPEPDGDLFSVDGLPGGFIKISRKALETMPAVDYLDPQGKPMKDWFPTGIMDGQYFGEDYGFCRLWKQAGGTVYLDPITLRHHDGNRVYSGDVRKWIEAIK